MSDDNKPINFNGFVDGVGNTLTMSDNCVSTDITIGSPSRSLQAKPRYEDVQHWIDKVQKKLEYTKSLSSALEKTIENLQSFTFTEGDVIISKSHGTGIVSGIGVGEGKYATAIDEQFPNSFYVVIVTKNGFVKVPPEDIMPYTRASKVLHERG